MKRYPLNPADILIQTAVALAGDDQARLDKIIVVLEDHVNRLVVGGQVRAESAALPSVRTSHAEYSPEVISMNTKEQVQALKAACQECAAASACCAACPVETDVQAAINEDVRQQLKAMKLRER